MKWVGKSVRRKEGKQKLTGQARYVDDLVFPGMLHGTTLRSTIARGKILKIHFSPEIPWHEFTVVTAKDIPGQNIVSLILNDQPLLVEERINHAEEAILLIAHSDKDLLQKARRAIRIEYQEEKPVFTLDESLTGAEVIWTYPGMQDNVLKSYLVQKGRAEDFFKAGSAQSKGLTVIEGTYRTGAQEQLYIENQGMIAVANAAEGVTVWGSLQCPYYVHKALKPVFGFKEDEKIRVIQCETGGGFGGKEEYPSIIAAHAALLAWKSGRPVKLIYDRAEDMACTPKRHPSRSHIKMAVDAAGKIQALDFEFILDGGAYATLSAVVLSRGTIHAAGPYAIPHVRIVSKAMATNIPPYGAFRGFGAPQSIFAMERHMDVAAHRLGLSPAEFRARNFLQCGESTATSQVIREKINFAELQSEAFIHCDYEEKRRRFAAENPGKIIKKGIGYAAFMHGAGFTGSGEKYLASVVGAEMTAERLRVLAASTEIGQGTNTIFSQIAADALGLELDDIEIQQPDTAKVPNSGPTVASRTTMVVGKLVERAAIGIRDTLIQSGLLKAAYRREDFFDASKKYLEKFGSLQCSVQYEQPPNVAWDDEKYQGDAYATYAWAVYVAEVSVDTRTYQIQVDDFLALQEVGKVIHPVLAAGQIEGGVAQGIGFALSEKVLWINGQMKNNQMTNYIMPTAVDTPPIRVFFREDNQNHGPSGAKGIGELPMDGPAPAILNAIEFAVGKAVNHIPFMPEDLAEVLHEQK